VSPHCYDMGHRISFASQEIGSQSTILIRLPLLPCLAIGLALAVVFSTGRSSAQTTPQPATSLKGVKVAITVDDLPNHGDPFPGIDRDSISRSILAALANNHVKGAWGFTNEVWDEKEFDILKEWLSAGYPLGNHTFSHLNLDEVDVHTYTSDIAHQDQILGSLANFSPLITKRKMFRYPFLTEGSSLAKRNEVRQYLFSQGYRVAEVTTDYLDWTWTDAYKRCRINNDAKSIDWLRAHVNDAADRYLSLSVEMARKLFHRDVDQILLIHIGAFDALTLDGILREWRSKGVKLIPLEEALKDPIYKLNPNLPYEGGLSFLEQIAEARNFDTRPFVENTYTIESMKKVCQQPTPAH
jgi:peptidoglycan/xylan/chitin deacetylase (PgdA/CDA1 family)